MECIGFFRVSSLYSWNRISVKVYIFIILLLAYSIHFNQGYFWELIY